MERHHHNYDFGEEMVHNIIHTIEVQAFIHSFFHTHTHTLHFLPLSVCAWCCLQHCFLPSFVGIVSRSRPACDSILGEGSCWQPWVSHHCCRILYMDDDYHWSAHGHGESVGLSPRPTIALGGVPEQVLPRSGEEICSLLVWHGRKTGGLSVVNVIVQSSLICSLYLDFISMWICFACLFKASQLTLSGSTRHDLTLVCIDGLEGKDQLSKLGIRNRLLRRTSVVFCSVFNGMFLEQDWPSSSVGE